MLIVVSPAKSLDYESPLATQKESEPVLLDKAAELVSVMETKSPRQLQKLMNISENLAELNFERFQNWHTPFTPETARPAVLAFAGDVYTGLDAPSFNQRDFTHAQKVFRILSGLYGVLRPLDMMMPYRLEMGTKLKTKQGKSLYDFWGTTITELLRDDIAASPGDSALINLASNEYFSSVKPNLLEAPVIAPVFKDAKGDGDPKIIAFFAKKARGSMSSWIIRNRVQSTADLTDFDGMGYAFDADQSSPDRPVFTRRHEA